MTQSSIKTKSKVLFICTGNAHRSPLAEALLKNLRPDLKVESAGLQTAIPISEEIRLYLSNQNSAQFLKTVPEEIETKRLEEYDLIIAMEPRHKLAIVRKCPQCESRTVIWNVKDPYYMSSEDAQKVYEDIKKRVEKLAETL